MAGVLCGLGVGNKKEIRNGLDIERSRAGREAPVLESMGMSDWPEILIKYINRAVAKISGVKETVARWTIDNSETGINGARSGIINHHHGAGGVDFAGPAGDGAILIGKQKATGRREFSYRYDETGTRIKNTACRFTAGMRY